MPERILPSGRKVALVPREQLRFRSHGRTAQSPTLIGLLGVPTPPPTPAAWDYSKGETLKFPCLANGPPDPNPVGDCYYEAVEHGSQCFTGNAGSECSFDAAKTKARYLRISGGDNGLSDQDIMPEWKTGIVGPNGPRRILDEIVVDMSNRDMWLRMFYACGGLIWTCSLLEGWLSLDSPGAVWDAGSRPDPSAGHAMFLTGRHAHTDTRTWGISPAIQVTDAGFAAAESEFIAAFSADQFKPDGTCAFTGMSWEDKRQWWKSVGGADVGPSPFGPTPVPPIPAPPLPPPTPQPVPTPTLPTVLYGKTSTQPFSFSVPSGFLGLSHQTITLPGQVLTVTVPTDGSGGDHRTALGSVWDVLAALARRLGPAVLKYLSVIIPVVVTDVLEKKSLPEIEADVLAALAAMTS